MPRTPWVGLLALAAIFVIPFLPDWLFEGPRAIVHRPRRHVCGDCGAPWTRNHVCWPEPTEVNFPPLRGELRRPGRTDRGPRQLTARRQLAARRRRPGRDPVRGIRRRP
jgi:hypothetical protein